MSIYSLTFFGFLPVGSLWIGMTAEKLGVPTALVINASLLLISAITVSIFMPKLRLQK
jgi:hypothetical protein